MQASYNNNNNNSAHSIYTITIWQRMCKLSALDESSKKAKCILQSSSSSGLLFRLAVWTDVDIGRRINYCIIVLEFSIWVCCSLCVPHASHPFLGSSRLLFGFRFPTSVCFFFVSFFRCLFMVISSWIKCANVCFCSIFVFIIIFDVDTMLQTYKIH